MAADAAAKACYRALMSSPPDDTGKPAPAGKTMAELLAAKKAGDGSRPGKGGGRFTERDAAARSAAQSKPAPRKG